MPMSVINKIGYNGAQLNMRRLFILSVQKDKNSKTGSADNKICSPPVTTCLNKINRGNSTIQNKKIVILQNCQLLYSTEGKTERLIPTKPSFKLVYMRQAT